MLCKNTPELLFAMLLLSCLHRLSHRHFLTNGNCQQELPLSSQQRAKVEGETFGLHASFLHNRSNFKHFEKQILQVMLLVLVPLYARYDKCQCQRIRRL